MANCIYLLFREEVEESQEKLQPADAEREGVHCDWTEKLTASEKEYLVKNCCGRANCNEKEYLRRTES